MTGRAAAYTDEGRQSQLSPGISEFAAAIQDLARLINVCDDVLTRRVRNIFSSIATAARILAAL
ncbi:hypothetical protein J2W42_000372 [Rhizobium tibeticum]|uniref:hypothetical protein n=1 Tax=Rhizobium tibeticum TaxID=501024 RepID=UPI00116072A7|nr:hypothetical protein [Rhizobium tibeticum]MDP9807541.1 hypothetical protein [Rhizobium tibeticum]